MTKHEKLMQQWPEWKKDIKLTHNTEEEPQEQTGELLPCPFCGGEAIELDYGVNDLFPYIVKCKNEDCYGNHDDFEANLETARQRWNNRTPSTMVAVPQADIDALEEAAAIFNSYFGIDKEIHATNLYKVITKITHKKHRKL